MSELDQSVQLRRNEKTCNRSDWFMKCHCHSPKLIFNFVISKRANKGNHDKVGRT